MARLALMLGAFVALGPLTIDMYLPALPTITRGAGDHVGDGPAHAHRHAGRPRRSASWCSARCPTRFGRRRPLLAGTALHVARLAARAGRPEHRRPRRAAGAAGRRRAAAGAVIALAVVRDLFDGRAAATMLSRLFLVIGRRAGARADDRRRDPAVHLLARRLRAAGRLRRAAARRRLRSPCARRCRPSAAAAAGSRGTLRGYGALLRDRTYVGLVLVAGLTMAGLFTYVSGSSFVYQGEFGLDEQQFGLLFGAGAVWLIAATQLNPRAAPPLVAAAGAGRRHGVGRRRRARRWSCSPPPAPAGCPASSCRCGRCSSPAAWRCPTPRRSPSPGTARPPAPPPPCWARSSSASAPLVSPLVGLLGNDAVAMGAVVVAALSLAIVVLVVVVRPWQLGEPQAAEALA